MFWITSIIFISPQKCTCMHAIPVFFGVLKVLLVMSWSEEVALDYAHDTDSCSLA